MSSFESCATALRLIDLNDDVLLIICDYLRETSQGEHGFISGHISHSTHSLSRTNKRLRALLLPYVFKEVGIKIQKQDFTRSEQRKFSFNIEDATTKNQDFDTPLFPLAPETILMKMNESSDLARLCRSFHLTSTALRDIEREQNLQEFYHAFATLLPKLHQLTRLSVIVADLNHARICQEEFAGVQLHLPLVNTLMVSCYAYFIIPICSKLETLETTHWWDDFWIAQADVRDDSDENPSISPMHKKLLDTIAQATNVRHLKLYGPYEALFYDCYKSIFPKLTTLDFSNCLLLNERILVDVLTVTPLPQLRSLVLPMNFTTNLPRGPRLGARLCSHGHEFELFSIKSQLAQLCDCEEGRQSRERAIYKITRSCSGLQELIFGRYARFKNILRDQLGQAVSLDSEGDILNWEDDDSEWGGDLSEGSGSSD